MTQCPFEPYYNQTSGGKAKSITAMILIPLSSCVIDLMLLFISSYIIRAQLPSTSSGGHTLSIISFVNFAVTFTALFIKFIDTLYDMLVALAFPSSNSLFLA
jgi:hypothetical protein